MSDWDPDISAMTLSEPEKNGLQVYRNYTQAFEQEKAKRAIASVQYPEKALSDLTAVLELLAQEEPKVIPVIFCAFADDQLKEMYRREIPQSVPGGRNELLNGFGPLARLSQKVQIAYAFNWLSEDVLTEIDHLRKIRNDISHKWDLKVLQDKLTQLIDTKQHPIENYLGDGVRLPENFQALLNPIQKFRVRLLWLASRLTYETNYWVPVLKHQLAPHKVLYGNTPVPFLQEISAVCLKTTRTGVLGYES